MAWNCQGLSHTKTENEEFVNILLGYDIIFLLESWTNKSSDLELSGYKSFNFFRKFQHRNAKRNSGGIVVYCRNEIVPGIEVVKNSFDVIVWLRLDKSSSSTFLVNGDAYILSYRLHTYLGLNINGSPY